ncbi:ciliary microtubule inner protein 5-like isoform X2 [Antedon mediterranea]|uniref:ciliary microtubule inner protein 5-like isoform X2 n=1 Tax=Antedon mediterranea TaxID=105859 RepID=UPI003AF5FFF9
MDRYDDMSNAEQIAYHGSCVPKERSVSAPPQKNYTDTEIEKSHVVNQDKIWRETVGREQNAVKKWEQGWGFLKDYDQKGNIKEKPKPPKNRTVFADSLPNTGAQTIGHLQKTGQSNSMVMLQNKFSQTHRRKRAKDLLCYD